MKRIYCDWCEKEISEIQVILKVSTGITLLSTEGMEDLCYTCFNKIKKLRKEIKKNKKKEK